VAQKRYEEPEQQQKQLGQKPMLRSGLYGYFANHFRPPVKL
jgi:hypothetical protein